MRPLRLVLPLALTAAGCASAPEPAGPGALDDAGLGHGRRGGGADRGRPRGAAHRLPEAPSDLMVATPLLKGGAGEVRLEVGANTYGLTGQGAAPALTAVGPMPETLPAAVTSGDSISLRHGRRTIGPYPALDPKMAAAFAIACRGPVG
ncbi:hypothetical protein [Phenylobacterium sp. J367]|uniref:hypothetical protein n=1 Tax=Phenylobacterium sp. J367 TaxID=2898435 RepID=UPI002150E4CA|nr:hypothetical protein [Phenylobacterium sp. J367]MCR5879058.1 hypothetical protein [Phenylobacterium sp. J367]